MALTRRLIVLLEDEDHALLERIAIARGMATSTLARSMILDGMTRHCDMLRNQKGNPSDITSAPPAQRVRLDGRSRRPVRRDEQG